jgi:hypothetical protein
MWSRIICAIKGHTSSLVFQDKESAIYECERCHLFLAVPSPKALMDIEMGRIFAADYLKEMARKDLGLDKGEDTDQ